MHSKNDMFIYIIKRRLKQLALLIVVVVALLIVLSYDKKPRPSPNNVVVEKFANKPLIILDWTLFFGEPLSPVPLASCSDLNCTMTTNRTLLMDSSAVLFHLANLNWKDLPNLDHRNPDQLYGLLSHESPVSISAAQVSLKPGKTFFNISLTYRRDSTVYWPYGVIEKRPVVKNISDNQLVQIARKKTKMIAWIVSNCHPSSMRERYVHELKKHIDVDIFGKCNNRTLSHEGASEMLRDNYKFYLAFENSNCKDYVTEKFMQAFFDGQYIVPVVLWGKNYVDLAPTGSYIAADQFASPADLARHLRQLASDDDAYARMLVSRRTHRHTVPRYIGLCLLCSQLRQYRTAPRQMRIADVGNWWHDPTQCDNGLVDRLLKAKL